MKRQKLKKRLDELWKEKHFNFLKHCFKCYENYYEDSVSQIQIKDGYIEVDGLIYTQEGTKKALLEYYIDDNSNYQSKFGDIVYLFFTDLVENKFNKLIQLSEA